MGLRDLLRRIVPGRDARHHKEADRLRAEVVGHYKAGHLHDAETVARRLLALQERALGPRHPDYATGLTNLAALLQARNDPDGAATALQDALTIRQAALGADHPETRACRRSLDALRQPPAPAPAKPDPLPTTSCPETAARLATELAALRSTFATLAERLKPAARRAFQPGAPPSHALIDELAASRRAFLDLRLRVTRRARAPGVAAPPADRPSDLNELAGLIGALAESESRRGRIRDQAVAVLDRALGLAHVGPAESPALRQCQARARALRDAITKAPLLELPPEAAELAEGTHPFAALLTLLDHVRALPDVEWAALHAVVARAFGNVLAAAAVRSRLVHRDRTHDRV